MTGLSTTSRTLTLPPLERISHLPHVPAVVRSPTGSPAHAPSHVDRRRHGLGTESLGLFGRD
jgi:hypothetical protein